MVVKRAFDVMVSATALIVVAPLLAFVVVAVWLQDFDSPFYVPARAALGGGTFRMVKFRSMRVGADRTGVNSTSSADSRITPVGRIIRAYKLDELMQLWNVLKGDMSLVGPRPQVMSEVALYTQTERALLSVRPGITDLASIVFSDEGEVLKTADDPDRAYDQLIRPWKSRLGLAYVQHASLRLDLESIALTVIALISRPRALAGIQRVLERLDVDECTRRVARRNEPLNPYPPPGASSFISDSQRGQ